MRVHDAHFILSRHAADLANEAMIKDPRIPPQYLNVFSPSGQYDLGLHIDAGMLVLDDEIVGALQEIGRDAVKQALLDNPKLFVGLILGEARKGRNYFTTHHD